MTVSVVIIADVDAVKPFLEKLGLIAMKGRFYIAFGVLATGIALTGALGGWLLFNIRKDVWILYHKIRAIAILFSFATY